MNGVLPVRNFGKSTGPFLDTGRAQIHDSIDGARAGRARSRSSSRFCRACFAAAALACSLAVLAPALAQYPDKPVRFLVGFPAGALTDLSARALANIASRYLEQQVVVVNVPGAAGALAMNELAKSAPDGYTIAMMTTSYKALVIHQQKPPYDIAEIRTLMGYAEFRQLLFVKGDSPVTRRVGPGRQPNQRRHRIRRLHVAINRIEIEEPSGGESGPVQKGQCHGELPGEQRVGPAPCLRW